MSDEKQHLTKNEFLAHIDPIREDIKQLVQLQREQNGNVADVKTRVAVLEERSPKREAGGISALVSAVISGLAWWASSNK